MTIVVALGILAFVASFGVGLAAGWVLRDRLRRTQPPPLSDYERLWLQEQRRAFHAVQNYNADTAYGITDSYDGR